MWEESEIIFIVGRGKISISEEVSTGLGLVGSSQEDQSRGCIGQLATEGG